MERPSKDIRFTHVLVKIDSGVLLRAVRFIVPELSRPLVEFPLVVTEGRPELLDLLRDQSRLV